MDRQCVFDEIGRSLMQDPRLHSLRVENFRSIAGYWEVPLDGEVVLVHGSNGAGKTSLLSALELGATGDVRFLSAEDDLDQSLILNRNYPLGSVELRVENSTGPLRSGTYEFDRSALRGNPALDPEERSFFAERSFLAQTQLGRFLETYTASSKQADSALVRFVKSLVGLEDLDALIDGLYSAGHVSRTRNASERWSAAQKRIETLQAQRLRARRRLDEALGRADQASASLRELVHADQAEDASALAADVLRVEHGDGEAEIALLESVRLRLDGVRGGRATGELAAGGSPNGAELANRAADHFAEWEVTIAPAVLTAVNGARQELFSLPPVTTARLFETFDQLRERVGHARAEQQAIVKQREESELERSDLILNIAGMSSAVQDAANRVAAIELPGDARLLIESLTMALPTIHGNACPVCDQSYAGGAHALTAHVEAKLTRLSSSSRELLEAETHHRELRARLSALEDALERIAPPAPMVDIDFAPALRQLNSLEESVEVGRALLHSVQTSQAKTAEMAARRAADDAATRALSAIREALGEPAGAGSIDQEVENLSAIVDRRITDAHFRIATAARIREVAQLVINGVGNAREAEQEFSELDREMRQVEATIKEASSRKDAANDLKKHAERVRSDVISRVFDDTLNGLWADLFKRFAPSEPFVPRFRKQAEVSRFVDVHLQTILENGDVAGAPGEMLSFGNSNSAALSLFIALHLSAPSHVPWLVFDDPVQSMDDIHIANFATVVRQLAYRHERQVVVAVHQQELFDYLSLELAPASPNQSLIKIEVDRANGMTRIDWDRVLYRPEIDLKLAQ